MQVQRRKPVLDRADYVAPIRQRELDDTDHRGVSALKDLDHPVRIYHTDRSYR